MNTNIFLVDYHESDDDFDDFEVTDEDEGEEEVDEIDDMKESIIKVFPYLEPSDLIKIIESAHESLNEKRGDAVAQANRLRKYFNISEEEMNK